VGGNTSCVQVTAGDELLIFDAGTGLRALGAELKPRKASFFFSHLHWDHIQGFPFFGPAFIPGNHFVLYGPGKGGARLSEALHRQMLPPTFPVTLDAMGARLDFAEVKDGTVLRIGAATVTARSLNHPQGCLGFRVDFGGKSAVYATDFEPLDDGSIARAALELCAGADLLICDAQYTEDEYQGRSGPCRRGWGHNTVHDAALLAREAGVKSLVLFRHDPSHDDQTIARLETSARSEFREARAAREGLQLTL
jgi:phosphoribosyl 1,2-cyclic phosphodiesterase